MRKARPAPCSAHCSQGCTELLLSPPPTTPPCTSAPTNPLHLPPHGHWNETNILAERRECIKQHVASASGAAIEVPSSGQEASCLPGACAAAPTGNGGQAGSVRGVREHVTRSALHAPGAARRAPTHTHAWPRTCLPTHMR